MFLKYPSAKFFDENGDRGTRKERGKKKANQNAKKGTFLSSFDTKIKSLLTRPTSLEMLKKSPFLKKVDHWVIENVQETQKNRL